MARLEADRNGGAPTPMAGVTNTGGGDASDNDDDDDDDDGSDYEDAFGPGWRLPLGGGRFFFFFLFAGMGGVGVTLLSQHICPTVLTRCTL